MKDTGAYFDGSANFRTLRINEEILAIGERYRFTFDIAMGGGEMKFQAGNSGTPPLVTMTKTTSVDVDWVIPADATGSTETRFASVNVVGMEDGALVSNFRCYWWGGP